MSYIERDIYCISYSIVYRPGRIKEIFQNINRNNI
jgi:hypothetical protein